MEMAEIQTERLSLKQLGEDDKQTLISEIGNWEVAKWLSSVPHPYTQEDADNWLKIISTSELNLNIFRQNMLIGGVGLAPEDDGYHELGYWLGQQYWGKGYATEAAKGFLQYAADALHLKKFEASYMEGNDESANVLKKLGFKTIGEGEFYCLSRKQTVASINLILEY